MGRHRKHNRHLPRGVTLEHGSHYFRGADRKRINLGRDFADAMRKYGELFREVPLATFGDVLDRYLQLVTPSKAERTQKDEHEYIGKIRLVFGRMTPGAILPTHVYGFRDKLAAKSGAVQANHHLKTLKHIFSKAIEWGAVTSNPAREVRKLSVKARDRYITDEEYLAVYAAASERVRVAMDLALLTGLRRGDLLSLTRLQLKDDGIHVQTSKTGKRLIIEWNDELTEVIARAKKIKPQFRQNVIATRSGKPYSGHGFATIWQRAIAKAIENGGLTERFTFNDLRSKSASDSADVLEASERLGHSSIDLTRRVYRRKPAKVRPLLRRKEQVKASSDE